MRRARALLLLALFPLAALAACARAMEVGSDPRPAYRVAVHNDLAEPLIVSYADERGTALLGTVQGGGTEHYVIASPASLRISITARNTSGSRTLGPIPVQLIAGESVPVRLR